MALSARPCAAWFGGWGSGCWQGWAQADGEARRGAARAEPEQAILAYCTGAPAPEKLSLRVGNSGRPARQGPTARQGRAESEITSAIPAIHAGILPVIPAGASCAGRSQAAPRNMKKL